MTDRALYSRQFIIQGQKLNAVAHRFETRRHPNSRAGASHFVFGVIATLMVLIATGCTDLSTGKRLEELQALSGAISPHAENCDQAGEALELHVRNHQEFFIAQRKEIREKKPSGVGAPTGLALILGGPKPWFEHLNTMDKARFQRASKDIQAVTRACLAGLPNPKKKTGQPGNARFTKAWFSMFRE